MIKIFFDIDDQPTQCEPIFHHPIVPSAPDSDTLLESLFAERETQGKIIDEQHDEIARLKERLKNHQQLEEDLNVARGQLIFNAKKLIKMLKILDINLTQISAEIHSPLSTESCIQTVQLWDKLETFLMEWTKNPKQAQLKTYKSELMALQKQNEETKRTFEDHLTIINRLETVNALKTTNVELLKKEMSDLFEMNASLLTLLNEKDAQLAAADSGSNWKNYLLILILSFLFYIYLFSPVQRLI